jgi:hypothetical protein
MSEKRCAICKSGAPAVLQAAFICGCCRLAPAPVKTSGGEHAISSTNDGVIASSPTPTRGPGEVGPFGEPSPSVSDGDDRNEDHNQAEIERIEEAYRSSRSQAREPCPSETEVRISTPGHTCTITSDADIEAGNVNYDLRCAGCVRLRIACEGPMLPVVVRSSEARINVASADAVVALKSNGMCGHVDGTGRACILAAGHATHVEPRTNEASLASAIVRNNATNAQLVQFVNWIAEHPDIGDSLTSTEREKEFKRRAFEVLRGYCVKCGAKPGDTYGGLCIECDAKDDDERCDRAAQCPDNALQQAATETIQTMQARINALDSECRVLRGRLAEIVDLEGRVTGDNSARSLAFRRASDIAESAIRHCPETATPEESNK